MKKFLALLLVLSLTVSMFAVGVEATGTSPTIVSAVALNDTADSR